MTRITPIFLIALLILSGCGDNRPSRPDRPAIDDGEPVISTEGPESLPEEEPVEPAAPEKEPEEASQAPMSEETSATTPAATGDWGDLTGKFVVAGIAPKAAELLVVKDKQFCGKQPLFSEEISVNEKGELANVCLWISYGRGEEPVEPHESYDSVGKEPLFVDNDTCMYVPHVLMAYPGQKLILRNKDEVAHNYKIEGFSNTSINVLVGPGQQDTHQFDEEERYPMPAACNIHPWMTAKLLIKESPYMAVSQADGTFAIKNLPVGKHKFQIWQEKIGNVDKVSISGKPTSGRKGIYEFEIKPGDNNLGEISINADEFE